MAQGKSREAVSHFTEAASVYDEQTPLFLFTLAKAYLESGETHQSLDCAKQARQAATSFSQFSLLSEIDEFLNRHSVESPKP
jgi:hypothetical protein